MSPALDPRRNGADWLTRKFGGPRAATPIFIRSGGRRRGHG